LKNFGASIFKQLSLKNRQNEHFGVENELNMTTNPECRLEANLNFHGSRELL